MLLSIFVTIAVIQGGVSAAGPCEDLCQRDGPSFCREGSRNNNGICTRYFYMGNPADRNCCYHSNLSNANCPAYGEPVKVSEASDLVCAGVVGGAWPNSLDSLSLNSPRVTVAPAHSSTTGDYFSSAAGGANFGMYTSPRPSNSGSYIPIEDTNVPPSEDILTTLLPVIFHEYTETSTDANAEAALPVDQALQGDGAIFSIADLWRESHEPTQLVTAEPIPEIIATMEDREPIEPFSLPYESKAKFDRDYLAWLFVQEPKPEILEYIERALDSDALSTGESPIDVWRNIRGHVLLQNLEASPNPVILRGVIILVTNMPNVNDRRRFGIESGLASFCSRNAESVSTAVLTEFARSWVYRLVTRDFTYAQWLDEFCPGLDDDNILLRRMIVSHRIFAHFNPLAGVYHPGPRFSVHRENVFEESVSILLSSSAARFSWGVNAVSFIGESASGQGLTRDWFSQLTLRIFDESNMLFTRDESAPHTYSISSRSSIAADQLRMFRAVGRFFGLALMHGTSLGVNLPRWFFSYLLGQHIELEDIQEDEPTLYRSLVAMLNAPTDQLEYFIMEIDGVEYIPTESNRHEIVNRRLAAMIGPETAQQFIALRNGFNEVVPIAVVGDTLTGADLWRILIGEGHIDAEDLVRSIVLQAAHNSVAYTSQDDQINWLMTVLLSMSQEELQAFLLFVTGSRFPPFGGFVNLRPAMTVQRVDASDRLPTSSTCFNLFRLPLYPSMDVLRQRLFTAIQEGAGAMQER